MADGRHNPESCARAWHILRTAHNVVAVRLESELQRQCQLSIHEFDALLHLAVNENLPVKMLDLLGPVPLSQPALSRLVTRLCDRGLIVRSSAEDDGRARELSLTEQGADLAQMAIQIHADTVQASLTGRISETEQTALLELLNRIATDSA
jgi:DNA-binding MarR family transcriptional regulator